MSYPTSRPFIATNRSAPILLGPSINVSRSKSAPRFDNWEQFQRDQQSDRKLSPRTYTWSTVPRNTNGNVVGSNESLHREHGSNHSGILPIPGTDLEVNATTARQDDQVSGFSITQDYITESLSGDIHPARLKEDRAPKDRHIRATEVDLQCTNQETSAANILLLMKHSPPTNWASLMSKDHGEPSSARCVSQRRLSKSSETSQDSRTSRRSDVQTRSTTKRCSVSNLGVPSSDRIELPPPIQAVPAVKADRKRSAAEMTVSNEAHSPSNKRKKVSNEAQLGKAWCTAIKLLPDSDLPSFAPPRSKFSGPLLTSSTSEKYNSVRGNSAKVDPKHRTLSVQEQKFIAAFGGRFSEEQYTDCKRRIFVCHRWRTEEDGLNHNIESSQQVCRVDVKVSTTIHKWFDSMHMFDQPWNVSNQTRRPAHMGRLQRATVGRNGRESTTKTVNVLEDL
ncbi:protein of unknown function [Taphrina deformans PYCC 5710]|uniref:SWIRM domain-containing protein n=1 Tax=Taphrina deformans (strain PYCC 5710 / ATCC 11124 / CBS 356.35 / IMI 108563 / JCM 9778 / NBRC 8474) TaxID=1097556 RepID=R4X6C2_TAPDE|nr:protein of unknown function [Taphrina deformans PYCC 5710]|eukprot:CCG80594.1 protein of unknown function [Taphrina deformans PYCC 5710]